MPTYTIVDKATGAVVEDGGLPLALRAPSPATNRWIRPAWSDAVRRDPEAAFAAAQAQADADAADPETAYGGACAAWQAAAGEAATAQAAAEAALAGDPQAARPATRDAVTAAQTAAAAAIAAREAAMAVSPSLGVCPPHLAGRAVLRDVLVTPEPGSDQRLGAWPAAPEVDLEAGTATWTRQLVDLTESEIASRDAAALAARRAAMTAAVEARKAALVGAGAPYGGLHIALDIGSRADLGGMATTAALAAAETVPWPADYAAGWISAENDRIPLDTPADGIALAAAAGAHYAAIVQRARTLKDAVLAAEDAAALDGVDTEAGWPDPA